MGANGATTTPYTLNGILQFLSVSTSVTLGGSLTVSSTTASTSTTTGALVVGGGIGVGGAINAGSGIAAAGTVVSASNTSPGAGVALSAITLGRENSVGSWIQSYGPSAVETLRLNPLGGSVACGGALTVSGKITTVSAVPASFADLAAVRTWLAAQFT